VKNSSSKSTHDELLVVVDAGGSKTAAWLVDSSKSDGKQVIGRGRASAGNPLSVGIAESTCAIGDAVSRAFAAADLDVGCASRALLSIAGAANEQLRGQYVEWARAGRFARRVAIVSDVLPVLAAGTENCCGVAVISGTGSVAYGRAKDGKTFLRGGWGYLLGDEGSGYAIGRAALQQALLALESGGRISPLVEAVLASLGVTRSLEVTRAIYGSVHPRVAIAAIAPHVIALADSDDAQSQAIVDEAADDLAKLVARTVQSIEPIDGRLAVAAAGGVLLSSRRLREQLEVALRGRGLECDLNFVEEPLDGCVRLAAAQYDDTLVAWQ
jgi:N-acetylglucosamine kinase-like BadF-type ATPase